MGVTLLLLGICCWAFSVANLTSGARRPHASFSRSPDETSPSWRWASTGLERRRMLGAAYAGVAVVLVAAGMARLI